MNDKYVICPHCGKDFIAVNMYQMKKQTFWAKLETLEYRIRVFLHRPIGIRGKLLTVLGIWAALAYSAWNTGTAAERSDWMTVLGGSFFMTLIVLVLFWLAFRPIVVHHHEYDEFKER